MNAVEIEEAVSMLAEQPFDAESFFVFKGRGYVISKQVNGTNASTGGRGA